MGDQYNNSGNNFGHMGPVNNFGPIQRDFSSPAAAAAREQLLQLPRDKHIKVGAVMGDPEAFALAKQIKAFLDQNGFTNIEAFHQSMFSEPPKGLMMNENAGVIELTVGHAR